MDLGAEVALGTQCAVTGNVKIGNCPFRLQGATMSRDGQKIAGVGSECSGSEVFGFTAMKR